MKYYLLLLVTLLGLSACSQQAAPSVTEVVLEETAVNPILTPAIPSSRLLVLGTKSVTFTVTTQDPSVVRADTSNKSFSSMSLTATSTDNKTHSFTIALQTDKPYSFYIKAAPKNNLSQPYSITRKVNYRVLRDYNPPYPRLFTLWWPQWGNWDDMTVANLSKLSVFILNIHPGANEPPFDTTVLRQARQRNPNLKLFTQYFSTYGCEQSMCDALEAADNDKNNPELHNKVFVRNTKGDKVVAFGEANVFNLANEATVDLLVSLHWKLWREDLLLFDGAFMDSTWRGFDGVYPPFLPGKDEIDLDLNGQADTAETRDYLFEMGRIDFLRKLRARMPNAILTANSVSGYPDRFDQHEKHDRLKDRNGKLYSYLESLDGKEYEDDIYALSQGDYWLSFNEFIKQYRSWCPDPKCFTLVPNKIVEDGSPNPNKAYQDLPAMRFGLATALMAEGTFLHGGWGFYTWFDEYNVNLGYPIKMGSPIASGSPVWRRDFDKGIALVNSSKTQTITVNLGGTYKAIQGTQDPTVNNGKTVTRVTLAPLDGRILLKP